MMTREQVQLIKLLAGGYHSVKAQAISIHRSECKRTGKARGTPAMDFMAEVDNPSPDLLLRSRYRKALLESADEESIT
jgi:hypothetical protein